MEINPTRRRFLACSISMGSACYALGTTALPTHADPNQPYAADKATVEIWMDGWMKDKKKAAGSLYLSRFADPIYFLTEPITWKPNPGQESVPVVTVPVGFVTDFASIPRIFWSVLPPDGKYTWAAIIHDYLYWTQVGSKATADSTLLYGMEDFGISTFVKTAIYEGVHLFGENAWQDNKRLKESGEKRILREFPSNPTITWDIWKKAPEHFER